jgi:hypothetical protein
VSIALQLVQPDFGLRRTVPVLNLTVDGAGQQWAVLD